MPKGFIPKKYSHIVFSFYMAAIMAFAMSAILTALNIGLNAQYLMRVLKTYAIAFPVAFSCVLLFRPLVVWLTNQTISSHDTFK